MSLCCCAGGKYTFSSARWQIEVNTFQTATHTDTNLWAGIKMITSIRRHYSLCRNQWIINDTVSTTTQPLFNTYIDYTVQAHTNAAAGHVRTAGVPLHVITKPQVAPAAGVKGSSRCCGWNAKAPARGAECPWMQPGSYYLPLCLHCLLSSALQGPPQKVLENSRPESDLNLLGRRWGWKDSERHQRQRMYACMKVCVCGVI